MSESSPLPVSREQALDRVTTIGNARTEVEGYDVTRKGKGKLNSGLRGNNYLRVGEKILILKNTMKKKKKKKT